MANKLGGTKAAVKPKKLPKGPARQAAMLQKLLLQFQGGEWKAVGKQLGTLPPPMATQVYTMLLTSLAADSLATLSPAPGSRRTNHYPHRTSPEKP